MAEYIEREALKRALRVWITECMIDGDNEIADGFRDCIDLIDDCPAADVAPVVHAYWIEFETMSWRQGIPKRRKYNRCSNCKTASAVRHKACPNCRAIMDADTQEREGGKPSLAWNGIE